MILKELLSDAMIKRFKADATIQAIAGKVSGLAEYNTFKKYKDTILVNDNMEFELLGVKANAIDLADWFLNLEINRIEIRLTFLCISKVPKAKREKLAKIKSDYENGIYIEHCPYKIPLWKELYYNIKLDDILSDNINLRIE